MPNKRTLTQEQKELEKAQQLALKLYVMALNAECQYRGIPEKAETEKSWYRIRMAAREAADEAQIAKSGNRQRKPFDGPLGKVQRDYMGVPIPVDKQTA